jgi:hypothetical protein
VNISGIDGESSTGGALIFTTFYEEKYTMETMDDIDGNGGGGEWHKGASIVDGCNGRGGVDGCPAGASTENAWNKKYGGGGWRCTPT